MKRQSLLYIFVTLMIGLLSTTKSYADDRPYLCEFGLQGGVGYYVGDAVQHIFMYPQYAAGAQFRYKFDQRWALQVKGQWQQIKYPAPDEQGTPIKDELLTNQIANIDVCGEFNFFRFGAKQYDSRVKPLTPYIFLGVGVGIYNGYKSAAAYFPFGFGLKWKFSSWCGLNLAWQHQLYFADNLENREEYDNYPKKDDYNMNGSNILKNDLTGTLTLGIVFEFGKERATCRRCQ